MLLFARRAFGFRAQGFASRGFRVQGLGFRQSSKRVLASAALIASAETVSCVSGASTFVLFCVRGWLKRNPSRILKNNSTLNGAGCATRTYALSPERVAAPLCLRCKLEADLSITRERFPDGHPIP